jgi:arylsulfatase A-like enzyme
MPPNVLWIFGDQHRGQALSCMGDPNVSTPNIDRLAVDGVCSTGAVSGTPLCCPYRGSLLTGRYPHQCVPGHEMPLPQEQQTQTVATAFKQAGYHTAWIGKWHVDGHHERDGRAAFHHIPRDRRGDFDQWLGYENNNAQWDCHVHGHDARGKEIDRYRLPGFETDELTTLLITHLHERAAAGKPFFAALSVQPPHDPYVAPEQWMAKHNLANLQLRPNVPNIPRVLDQARRELAGYYAMIENLDHNVGRVLAALEATGLGNDTHVIFFSDHGDMHGSQGQFRKTSPWEESVRVPFIMGGLQSRYDYRTGRPNLLVNHVDIAPTSLGLCGIDKPGWMVGHDYSDHRLKSGEMQPDPDSAYLQLCNPTRHGNSTDRPWRGVVTRDGWKYVCLEGQPWLMFNLNEDPYEQANLAHNTVFGAQRRKLHERLKQWIAETGDTFALPEG